MEKVFWKGKEAKMTERERERDTEIQNIQKERYR